MREKYYHLLLWYLCKNIHTPLTIDYSTAFFSVKYTCSTVRRLYYCLLLWYFWKIYLIHHLPPISYEGIAMPEIAVEKTPFFAFLLKKILLSPSIVPSEQYSYSTICGLCYLPFFIQEKYYCLLLRCLRNNIVTPQSAAYVITPFYLEKILLSSSTIASQKHTYSTILCLH
jgi:hypothetical protein